MKEGRHLIMNYYQLKERCWKKEKRYLEKQLAKARRILAWWA